MKPESVYLVPLPVPDHWSFNEFLDRQLRMIKASGANEWLLNRLMLSTLAAMGRLRQA